MAAAGTRQARIGLPYRTRNEELSAKCEKTASYRRALEQAGAEAVEISLGLGARELRHLADNLEGLLLPGSPADVDPAHYGAPRHPACEPADPDRERTDFALLENFLAAGKPVLAICYGIQSLNVFLGGSLVQDIAAELPAPLRHDWDQEKGEPEPFHSVRIARGGLLADLAGRSEAQVNSSHHQSASRLGRGLRIAAQAPDGIIEAVEWAQAGGQDGDLPGAEHSAWLLGVQWHPERMAQDALAADLFRQFVSAATMVGHTAR